MELGSGAVGPELCRPPLNPMIFFHLSTTIAIINTVSSRSSTMKNVTESSSGTPSRPSYSCVRCASRKVKCDRQRPCSACVKHKVDCVFNNSQAPRQKRKRARDPALGNRFRHYAALLPEKNIAPKKQSGITDSEPGACMSKTQVVHNQGRFKFVDK